MNHAEDVIDENGKEENADNSVAAREDVGVGAGDADIEKEDDHGGGDKEEEGKLFADGGFFNPDGVDHGGDADEQEDVEDVATHDVAEEHVGVAVDESRDGDG